MKKSADISNTEKLKWLAFIFLTAFIFRLVFLFEFESVPLFDTPTMDMAYHHQWAQAIANGTDYIDGSFFRAPLYPYFLGFIYTFLGRSFWIVKIIQAILGSLSVVLVFLIGLRAFNLKTTAIAALFCATCGTLIFYDGQLLVPSLAIFLNMLSLYFLVRAAQASAVKDYFLGGLVLGFSAIARPTVLLFGIVILLWILLRKAKGQGWKFVWIPTLAFFISMLLPIVPVTIHNYVKSHEFTPIGTYSGLNFYIGNNLSADGVSAKIPGARNDWWGMMEDARTIAENDVNHPLTDGQLSDYWLDKTFEEIFEYPGHFITLLFHKTIYLIQGIELSNNFDLYFFAHQTNLLKILIWKKILFYPWGLLLPLAVMGFFLSMKWNRPTEVLAIFILTYIPAIVLFFVTSRYRLPMVPVLSLFASAGAVKIISYFKNRPLKSNLLIGITLILLLLAANIDFYRHRPQSDAPGLYTMGSLYEKRGNKPLAEHYYRQSIQADSTFTQSYNELALLLCSNGNFDEALVQMEKGRRLSPNNYIYHYNLGYITLQAGHPDEAVAPFKDALRLNSQDLNTLNNLGQSYLQMNMYDSALIYIRRLARLDRNFPDAIFNLGYCLQNTGQVDKAIPCFYQALRLDNTNAEAYYNLGMIWKDKGEVDSAVVNLEKFLSRWQGDEETSGYVRFVIDSLKR